MRNYRKSEISEEEKQLIRETSQRLGSNRKVADELGIPIYVVRRLLYHDKGLCSCGREPVPGLTSCQLCLDRSREGHQRRQSFRRENAQCIFCGKPIDHPELSRTSCLEHLGKVRHFLVQLRAKRMTMKVCVQCEKPLVPTSNIYCEYHLMYHNKKSWEHSLGDLGEKTLERDGFKCAICSKEYSGKRSLHIHHIDKDNTHNVPENLVTLCMICHRTLTWLLMCKDPEGLINFFRLHYQG